MAFIDLTVAIKNRLCGFTFLIEPQDLLLILTGDLGVGDDERWDQGMRLAAEAASDTLDEE